MVQCSGFAVQISRNEGRLELKADGWQFLLESRLAGTEKIAVPGFHLREEGLGF